MDINNLFSAVQMIGSIVIPIAIFLVLIIWVCKGFKKNVDSQDEKMATYAQLAISFVLVIILFPIAIFIGGMATDNDPTTIAFLSGFCFIEGLPLLSLLLALIKFVIRIMLRKKEHT